MDCPAIKNMTNNIGLSMIRLSRIRLSMNKLKKIKIDYFFYNLIIIYDNNIRKIQI